MHLPCLVLRQVSAVTIRSIIVCVVWVALLSTLRVVWACVGVLLSQGVCPGAPGPRWVRTLLARAFLWVLVASGSFPPGAGPGSGSLVPGSWFLVSVPPLCSSWAPPLSPPSDLCV